jgi:hypothetical protein
MLEPVGRIAIVLLVLLVAALGARVLFVDARSPEDAELQGAPAALVKPVKLPEQPPAPALVEPEAEPKLTPKITIIDPDPDLDQNTEPIDCQGTPEQPVEPKPQEPAPH